MDIHMGLVTIDPPSPQVTLTSIQALEDMVLLCSDEKYKPTIYKLFSKLKGNVKGGIYGLGATLHAEAALMGVAYGTDSGELHDDISS